MAIKPSTFRDAVQANRALFDLERSRVDRRRQQAIAIDRASAAIKAVYAEAGIDPDGVTSPARYELQGRINAAINRAGDVDWGKV